jgi:hypothetical protein
MAAQYLLLFLDDGVHACLRHMLLCVLVQFHIVITCLCIHSLYIYENIHKISTSELFVYLHSAWSTASSYNEL